MNRREFISGLKEALELKMSKNEIDTQLEYYNDYIKAEIKSGRSEKDVVSDLGDPWAIAKNLGYESESVYEEETTPEADTFDRGESNKVYTTNSKWIVWGILFLIIAIIFAVLSFTMSVLSFFSPILLPIFFVMIIVRMFKK